MRIAWITTGFVKDENDFGGIASIHNLAKELSSFSDIELTIFALYYPIGIREYKFFDAKVYTFRKKGMLSLEVPKFDKLRAWLNCIKKFNQENAMERFDIIHSIWSGESGYVASYLSKKHQIPLITSICGGEVAEIPQINYGSRLKLFQKYFVGKTFKQAKVIGVGSDYINEKIQNYYGAGISSKTRKIPFGADENIFYPFKNLNVEKSIFKLINIATAFPVKSHKDLFNAFKIVVGKFPGIILECYGLDEKNTLKEIVVEMDLNNNIRLNGYIGYEKIPSVLNDAGIFVLSSLYESQNMAILEAAFCGLPVVSADVGIAREITSNIVKAGDYKTLADRIIYVLENYDAERKKAEDNLTSLRERFSLKASAEKFYEMYKSFIK